MGGTQRIQMSARAVEQLRAEVQELETVVLPAAIQAVADAVTDSVNLGESATYQFAVDHKDAVVKRLAEAKDCLARAEVVEVEDLGSVAVGLVVWLDFGDGEPEAFLVDRGPDRGVQAVSPDSPLGAAVMGSRRGDRVVWESPQGPMSAVVTEISTPS